MPASTTLPPWPDLPAASWSETRAALHRWLQIVGKVRLSADPGVNHCWGSTLYLTPTGFTTGAMYFGDRCAEVRFDLYHDQIEIWTESAERVYIDLEPQPVRDVYRAIANGCSELGLPFDIWPMPQEVGAWAEIPRNEQLDRDAGHGIYDGTQALAFHRLLLSADRLLKQFKTRFLGKQSPSHLFWGSFDLACTRFNGEPAPPHPGGIPGLSDRVTREAYSHACISAGFWAGDGGEDAPGEPAFYSYAYPAPEGFKTAAKDLPEGAYWMESGGEYVLPVSSLRTAADPDAAALQFLQAIYAAAADGMAWNRAAVERETPG